MNLVKHGIFIINLFKQYQTFKDIIITKNKIMNFQNIYHQMI